MFLSSKRLRAISAVIIFIMLLPLLTYLYNCLEMGTYWAELAVVVFTLLMTLLSLISEFGEAGADLRFYGSCAVSIGLLLAFLTFRRPDLFPAHEAAFYLIVFVGGGFTAMAWQILRAKERRPALKRAVSVFATVAGMLLAPVVGRWTHF